MSERLTAERVREVAEQSVWLNAKAMKTHDLIRELRERRTEAQFLARQVIVLREIAEEAVAGWASWAFDEGSEKEKALVNTLRARLAALDTP